MKITEIKVYQIDPPLKESRYNGSNGNIVEVLTDDSIARYAECCPLGSAYLPLGRVLDLAGLGPHLTGLTAAGHHRFGIASIFGVGCPVTT